MKAVLTLVCLAFLGVAGLAGGIWGLALAAFIIFVVAAWIDELRSKPNTPTAYIAAPGLACPRRCGYTVDPGPFANGAARMSAEAAMQTHLLIHAQQDNTPSPSAPPMSMN